MADFADSTDSTGEPWPKHDHQNRWDRSDVKALRELRFIGLTIAAIVLRLGRTPAAVRSKLYRLRKAKA